MLTAEPPNRIPAKRGASFQTTVGIHKFAPPAPEIMSIVFLDKAQQLTIFTAENYKNVDAGERKGIRNFLKKGFIFEFIAAVAFFYGVNCRKIVEKFLG